MRIKRVVTGALLVLLGMGGLDRGFAQSGPPMPPLPPGQLLDVWEFSGSNFFSLRKDAPISLTNVALVPTWAGNGLQVDDTNASWINYAVVEPNGQKNLDVAQGTVTMWLSFDFDSSDGLGAWGVILEAGNWDTNLASATGAWGIFISPDGSNLYFSAQTNGVLTNYCNTPIAWYAGDWHHLAVTFDSTNSAIYLDGAIADSGPGVTIIPGSEVLSNGFSIGSDGNDTGMLQARSVFNDVAIYDYPLDATTISNDYFYESQYVYPLPGGGGFGMDDGPSLPGGYDGGGGTNSSDGSTNGPGYSVPTNGFYLELLTFGTNAYNTNASAATILVHSTENDATNEPIYQLWSATNLNPPVAWTVEQTFLGTTNTNFTALIVSMTNRPTLFFEAVNLGSDPTDSSLPVWYLLQNGLDPTSLYTGTNLVSNAYLDPMGDGWTYQALFSSGMSPGVLYAPPAPSGFTAKLMTNGLVLLSWNPAANLPASGAGAVTGYTLVTDTYITNSLSSSQTSFMQDASTNYGFPAFVSLTNSSIVSIINALPSYSLQANYANTNSLWTASVTPGNNKCSITAAFVRGPGGKINLAVSAIPANVQAIRVFMDTFSSGSGEVGYGPGVLYEPDSYFFDVPVNSFTNGVYTIPDSQAPIYYFYTFFACAVANDGTLGPSAFPNSPFFGSFYNNGSANIPFIDGSVHLHQNLSFLLQAAAADFTFNFGDADDVAEVDTYAETNYAYAGFHYPINAPGEGEIIYLDEFHPFEDNCFFTNYVYRTGNLNSDGSLISGAVYDDENVPNLMLSANPEYLAFDTYDYVLAGSTNPPAPVLTNWQGYYFQGTSDVSPPPPLSEIGMYYNSSTSPPQLGLSNNIANYFGLGIQSVTAAESISGHLAVQNIPAGDYVTNFTAAAALYPATAAPQLQTVGYYFARPDYYQVGPPTTDLLPGEPDFAITNTTSPIMIATVGQQFWITAWAKQAITNGYDNVFGYMEQYFDKAYLGDTNNNITANQTGILSEYGEFFPTDPGMVYLTTKANDYSASATNAIEVIGLFTDANHDGTIDTRFSGPDFTSPTRPFRFWVNDDNDSGDTGGNDTPGEPASLGSIPNGLSGQVNGVRDLVDFFPVFIDIQSLVAAIPYDQIGNYQFILSQADGALNFVATSIDPGEPLRYLTDTNTAYALSNAPVTQITSNGVWLYPSGMGSGIILCEASAPTSNPLVLTIEDANSNVLATAQLYLSITGVEQMFRHKNLTRATYPNRQDGPLDRLADSDVPNEPDTNDKNFIFVHGYNVNPDEGRGWLSEVYKRMYWSGSHAKFYGVSWFGCDTEEHGITPNLQTNIIHAFETAPQLNTFLNSLSGTNVIAGHSLGNMLILSTLNDCGNTNLNTVFMMDAALAIEALDGSPANVNTNMVNSLWLPYGTNLWATYWCNLFPTNDYRSQLTWNNRLANTQNAQVYNFYSSGEEVLRNWTNGAAPAGLFGVAAQQVYGYVEHGGPFGSFTWALQELEKGRMGENIILSSGHNGWGFNTYYSSFLGTLMSPSNAAALTTDELQTNAFFDTSFFNGMFGPSGSTYAQQNTNFIIATAIPVVSQCTGANPVTFLDQPSNPHNFDMSTNTFENGWPITRQQNLSEPNNWYHSDMRVVAYTYTQGLFDKMVTLGNLQ